MSIGKVPEHLELEEVLEQIDETIMIADLSYTIVWMNNAACRILGPLYPLLGLQENDSPVGKHMDFFHSPPSHPHQIMDGLNHTHRTVISIKERYAAETVITPIYDNQRQKKGYLLMLLDVTEKEHAAQEKEQLIEILSTPILKIWDSVLAVPLLGNLTNERASRLIETVLESCTKERAEFFLLDLSSLSKIDDSSGYHITQICRALRLIGTECLIVGVSASLAASMSKTVFDWPTYRHAQQAIKEIMKRKGISYISAAD